MITPLSIVLAFFAFAIGAIAYRALLLVAIRRWERAAPNDEIKRERKWVAILFRHHVLNCRRWD